MNMKKNFIIIITILFSLFLFIPVRAFDLGSSLVTSTAGKAGYTDTSELSFGQKAGSIINIALSFLGVIFLVLMVYAGYLWLTARGEDEPISKSKKIMAEAVIGFVLVIGAYSITSLILPKILERTIGEGGGAGTLGSSELVGCCIRTFENGEQYAVVVNQASDCEHGLADVPLVGTPLGSATCAGQGVVNCEYQEVKGEANCKL